MHKLPALVAARRRLATQIRAAFPGLSWQRAASHAEPNHQTLGLLVGPEGQGSGERDRVLTCLREGGVSAFAQFSVTRASASNFGRRSSTVPPK